jgi:hypothetical protein
MATDSNRPSATDGGTSAGEATREVAHEAGSTAKELGREAMDQARSTAGYVREQARTSVEQGKNQVAQQIGGLAKAFHRGSEELRHDEMGRLAEQSEWLAGRVEELQRYLQERSGTELLDDLRGVARSQPGWFIGGMFAAGLVTARFLHSGDSPGGHRFQDIDRGSGAGQSYQARDTTRL